MSNSANGEAGRTLTREVLLSVRSTALKPDRSTRQRIVLLGCAGRRRGCRGGRANAKHKHFPDTGAEIHVVITRRPRLHSSLHGSCGEIRRSVLRPVELQQQFVPCFFTDESTCLSGSSRRSVLQESSCLHCLLPDKRDSTITDRLRHAKTFTSFPLELKNFASHLYRTV